MTTSPPVERERVRRSASAMIGNSVMKGSKEARFRSAASGCARATASIGGRHRVQSREQDMSESEHIAAAPRGGFGLQSGMDEEDRLRPEFVDKVLDAVDEGDDETARQLVAAASPGRRRRPDRACRARRARGPGQGACRDHQPRRARGNERLRPRRACSTRWSRSRSRTSPGSSRPTTRSR